MSTFGKQLDFLSIFDHVEENDNNIRPENDGVDRGGFKIESSADDSVAGAADFLEDESKIKKIRELKDRLSRLSRPPKISDFDDFLPELKAYGLRMESFRKDKEAAATPAEKEKIYYKIVNPDVNDEPSYRPLAALYLLYLEALKNSKRAEVEDKKITPIVKTPPIKKNLPSGPSNSGGYENPYTDIYPYAGEWRRS